MTIVPKINRRRFLGAASSSLFLGLSSSPAVALFTTILAGESQRAWASELGLTPRNFVQFLAAGGPLSTMFDLFLTPYSSAGVAINPMAVTRFKDVGGRYIGGEYVTVNIAGVNVPYMWQHAVPKAGGGYRPMADLLNNLLVICGVTTLNGGHEVSQDNYWKPPGALKSASALAGDASHAPFAALDTGASRYRNNFLGDKPFVSLSTSGNMLATILDAFRPSGTTTFTTNKATLKRAYDSILPDLHRIAYETDHPGARALVENRASALDLALTNFGTLGNEWNALVAKYQDLVTRAIYDPSHLLEGFNDKPIGEGGSGSAALYQINSPSALNLHLATDFRSAVHAGTTVGGLPESFAFCDYVLRKGLSPSLACGIGQIGPFRRESDGVIVTNESMVHDQHTTGFYPSLYFNALRNRAVAACLLELIDVLKGAGIFNDTLLSFSGEFNRDVRPDGTGSDHGWNGASRALYSGAIQGPISIGNLTRDVRASYLSWGAGGKIPELGNRQLTPVDVQVTLAHLLRVPPAFTSALPLVTLSSSGLVSHIGLTRQVPS